MKKSYSHQVMRIKSFIGKLIKSIFFTIALISSNNSTEASISAFLIATLSTLQPIGIPFF